MVLRPSDEPEHPLRFTQYFEGYLHPDEIDTIDSFGAARRIFYQVRESLPQWFGDLVSGSIDFREKALENGFIPEQLRQGVRDQRPEFVDLVRTHMLALFNDPGYTCDDENFGRVNTKNKLKRQRRESDLRRGNHVLFKHLPRARILPYIREVQFWDIGIPEHVEPISSEVAQAILDCMDTLRDLPEVALKAFPLKLDGYLQGHSLRTAIYAALLAQKLDNSDIDPVFIAISGVFHDIGKLHPLIQDLIKRPGRLNLDEMACVRTHPSVSAAVLKKFRDMGVLRLFNRTTGDEIIGAAHAHHVRRDGDGYPSYIDIEDVPNSAKLLAVADTFDAITSGRSHSDDHSINYAHEEMRRVSSLPFNPRFTKYSYPEKQLNPYLVSEFLAMNLKPIFFK